MWIRIWIRNTAGELGLRLAAGGDGGGTGAQRRRAHLCAQHGAQPGLSLQHGERELGQDGGQVSRGAAA